jgi:predicted phosphodiesterase
MKQLLKDRRRHLPVLLAFLGLMLFINLFSATDYQLLSAVVNLQVSVGQQGQTRIIVPPLGQVGAFTHWLPVRLNLELKSVDLSLLETIVFSPSVNSPNLLSEIKKSALRILLLFIMKVIALGAVGSAFLVYLGGCRTGRRLFLSGIFGAVMVVLIVGVLVVSYDLSAFEELEYQGMIEAAPWVLSLAWDAFAQVEELGARVQALASNLYSLLREVESLGPLGLVQAEVLVLHVSDIHNNPVAYNFAKQVADSFPVDFIMDTGDLTDWGTALEVEIAARIGEFRLPYLFVSGNHDSPQVLQKVSGIPNAVLITGEEQMISGLRIAGTGDLVADSYLATPASLQELEAYAQKLNEKWSEVDNPPDIFMVHNHRVAEALEPGLFPVVVFGHTHSWGIVERGNTVYCNAGTTGAAGLRGFQSREPLPYSLSLLYFNRDDQNNLRLQAVDGVHVTGKGTSFSLQRTFIRGRIQEDDVELRG